MNKLHQIQDSAGSGSGPHQPPRPRRWLAALSSAVMLGLGLLGAMPSANAQVTVNNPFEPICVDQPQMKLCSHHIKDIDIGRPQTEAVFTIQLKKIREQVGHATLDVVICGGKNWFADEDLSKIRIVSDKEPLVTIAVPGHENYRMKAKFAFGTSYKLHIPLKRNANKGVRPGNIQLIALAVGRGRRSLLDSAGKIRGGSRRQNRH